MIADKRLLWPPWRFENGWLKIAKPTNTELRKGIRVKKTREIYCSKNSFRRPNAGEWYNPSFLNPNSRQKLQISGHLHIGKANATMPQRQARLVTFSGLARCLRGSARRGLTLLSVRLAVRCLPTGCRVRFCVSEQRKCSNVHEVYHRLMQMFHWVCPMRK